MSQDLVRRLQEITGYKKNKPKGWTEDHQKVSFHNLKNHRQAQKIIDLWRSGDKSMIFDSVSYCYPNVAIPVALEIAGSKKSRKVNPPKNCNMDFISISEPITIHGLKPGKYLGSVIKFSGSNELNNIISMVMSDLYQNIENDEGANRGDLLEAIENSLSEVMGNVITHSEVDYGFIMINIEKNQDRLHICIGDSGIGIYESLTRSTELSDDLKPNNTESAIKLALERGVTRSTIDGAGNGLWTLLKTIEANKGSLAILSDGAGFLYRYDETEGAKAETFQSRLTSNGMTVVDFQISLENPVSLSEIYESNGPESMYIYKLSDDQTDFIDYKILGHGISTRTREDGKKLANAILNIHEVDGSMIMINFEGILTIPTSFADEVFQILLSRYGFAGTMSRFIITNANQAVIKTINAAINTRYYKSRA